jgi:hypothetical protein
MPPDQRERAADFVDLGCGFGTHFLAPNMARARNGSSAPFNNDAESI